MFAPGHFQTAELGQLLDSRQTVDVNLDLPSRQHICGLAVLRPLGAGSAIWRRCTNSRAHSRVDPTFATRPRPGIRLAPRAVWQITEVNVQAFGAIRKDRDYHHPGRTCGRQTDRQSS